jgi:outer membrane protein assembly factor BamB
MLLVRRACSVVLVCAFAVAGLAGCSSGHGPIGFCCPAPPKPAYALDVTTAGRVRWRVPLDTPPGSGLQVSPLAVGAVAVFAQSDVFIRARGGELLGSELYGLRLSDGHRLWSRAFTQDIAGMWRWQSLVVVLAQPGRGGPQMQVLTGLDASTGQARWSLLMRGGANGFTPTADGGLAITVDQDGVLELEVVDLSSGRVRWTSPVDSDAVPPVAVGGGAVLFAGGADGDANSSLTSYDDRTGQVRWTEALKPGIDTQPPLQASAGLVYMTAEVLQAASGSQTWVLLGISAADGRVKWRFAPKGLPETLGLDAPGLMSITTNAYSGTSQDELDPATGRVRWHVVSPYPAIATPAGIVTTPGPDQISMRYTLTGHIRWTARLNGGWLPLDVGQVYTAVQNAGPLTVLPAGRFLIVPAAGADGSDLLAAFRMSDGNRTWQVTIPGPVAAPLSAEPGGILVYAV